MERGSFLSFFVISNIDISGYIILSIIEIVKGGAFFAILLRHLFERPAGEVLEEMS